MLMFAGGRSELAWVTTGDRIGSGAVSDTGATVVGTTVVGVDDLVR